MTAAFALRAPAEHVIAVPDSGNRAAHRAYPLRSAAVCRTDGVAAPG